MFLFWVHPIASTSLNVPPPLLTATKRPWAILNLMMKLFKNFRLTSYINAEQPYNLCYLVDGRIPWDECWNWRRRALDRNAITLFSSRVQKSTGPSYFYPRNPIIPLEGQILIIRKNLSSTFKPLLNHRKVSISKLIIDKKSSRWLIGYWNGKEICKNFRRIFEKGWYFIRYFIWFLVSRKPEFPVGKYTKNI